MVQGYFHFPGPPGWCCDHLAWCLPQAPIYFKNQTEYFPIFSFFTIPFDFSKRRKEERNWILAGNFDQEMGACFLREKKNIPYKKES